MNNIDLMNHSFSQNSVGSGILELTSKDLAFISGGDDQITTGVANGLAGFFTSVFYGSVAGGVGGAAGAAYMGNNWAHYGIGGMLTGGIAGGFAYLRPRGGK